MINFEKVKSYLFINNDYYNYTLDNLKEITKIPMNFMHDLRGLGKCYVKTCSYFSVIKKEEGAQSDKDSKIYFDDGSFVKDYFLECFAQRLYDKVLKFLSHKKERFDFEFDGNSPTNNTNIGGKDPQCKTTPNMIPLDGYSSRLRNGGGSAGIN